MTSLLSYPRPPLSPFRLRAYTWDTREYSHLNYTYNHIKRDDAVMMMKPESFHYFGSGRTSSFVTHRNAWYCCSSFEIHEIIVCQRNFH